MYKPIQQIDEFESVSSRGPIECKTQPFESVFFSYLLHEYCKVSSIVIVAWNVEVA